MAKDTRRLITSKLPKRMTFGTPQRQVLHIGRNERCPCGSGKKYKDCHQSAGEEFLSKLAEERDRAARRAHLPWYRRWLGI